MASVNGNKYNQLEAEWGNEGARDFGRSKRLWIIPGESFWGEDLNINGPWKAVEA